MVPRHEERYRTERNGWLGAAVLCANDGIVSTASLVVGVVAGAMSMAASEYVSVNSQSDTEKADLDRERKELGADPESERAELDQIYVRRGMEASLANRVAEQLTACDALAAHARHELGVSHTSCARPAPAALASAGTFSHGVAVPLSTVLAAPAGPMIPVVTATSIVLLALLSGFGTYAGGAPVARAALQVTFWGALAMALTAGSARCSERSRHAIG